MLSLSEPWSVIEFSVLLIAAVIIALKEYGEQLPEIITQIVPAIFKSRHWAALPLILIGIYVSMLLLQLLGVATKDQGEISRLNLPASPAASQTGKNSTEVADLQSALNATRKELEDTKKLLDKKVASPSTQVLPPLESDILENLRRSDGVTLIDPTQNDLPLRRIPNGKFAYIWFGEVEKFTRDQKYPLTISDRQIYGLEFEIHKAQDGKIFIIGFLAEQDALQFQDPTGHILDYTIFNRAYKDNAKPVKIPLTDIKECSWHAARVGGESLAIGEIRLKVSPP